MALTRLQPAALQPSAFSGLNITDGSLYPVDLSSGAPLWDSAGSITIQTPNSSSSYLKFSSPNTTSAALIGGYDDGTGSGHLEFYTKNAGTVTEWARLTSTGNLGIGTNSPASKLHVSGSFRQTGATAPFEWTVNAGAADYLKLNAVGYADNLIVANSAGNVGIGTNSPNEILEVNKLNTTGFSGIRINNPASGTSGSQMGIDFYNSANYQGRISSFRDNNEFRINCVANGAMTLYTNNAERMRIDSSGNVSIGTSTASTITGSIATLSLGGTNANVSGGIAYQVNGTVKAYDYVESNVRKIQTVSGVAISFNPGGTEVARIDTSGWLLLGVTSSGNIWAGTDPNNGITFNPAYSAIQCSTNTNLYLSKKAGYTASAFIEFYVNGGIKGNINTNGTTVSFNTSSDYRLKENVQPMVGALATVAALKPCTYTWKEDGSDGQGFIAHELQEVVPDCVTGDKDAVDDNGNPKYQGIDTSFLVATLTAAIQEQQAIIDSLKARLDAAGL